MRYARYERVDVRFRAGLAHESFDVPALFGFDTIRVLPECRYAQIHGYVLRRRAQPLIKTSPTGCIDLPFAEGDQPLNGLRADFRPYPGIPALHGELSVSPSLSCSSQ